jgi:DNA helicase HerA-like ATPase
MIQTNEKMITDEIKKLIPVLGRDNAAALGRAYLLGDEEVRKRIFELVDAAKAAVFSNEEMTGTVLIEPPDREVFSRGDFKLGTILYGKKKMYPMRMKKEALLMHMGIFGSSGYGKTNLSYDLIKELSEKGVPVLVFDFSKRNYKDLLSTSIRDRIQIFTIGRNVAPFKFNPLRPPSGVLMSQWMKEFAQIFDHAYWLLGGGRHVILKALDNIVENNEEPRLSDIKDWLVGYKESTLAVRERNWLATAERPIDSLCFKELGEVFDCDRGILPSDFFKRGRVTILELESLDTNDKGFFIEILLQWIRDWLIEEGGKEKLRGVIILEEAHHVLNREKAKKMGSETVVDLIFREIRELGIGMVYIDQHPSLVSYPALGNTSTQIYMNLGLDTKQSSDVYDASNMLGLNYDEQGYYLRRLPIGHGFMLCRGSDFPEPFLISFPKFDMEKGTIFDKDIVEFMKDRLPKEVDSRRKEKPIKQPGEYGPDIREDKELEGEISDDGWKIMKILGSARGTFASQIYKDLKMSGNAFKNKVDMLIDLNVVGMKTGKIRKNKLNYYFLTELGQKLFDARFGSPILSSSVKDREIVETFELGGWKSSLRDGIITIEKNKKTLNIVVQKNNDRQEIAEKLRKYSYFICSTDTVENIVIQEAARSGKPVLFTSTDKEFEEEGKFEKIQFQKE